MPTTYWISETADDRHSAYLHEAGVRLTDFDTHRPFFRCADCEREFHTTAELHIHLQNDHPIARPRLYINGMPVTTDVTIAEDLDNTSIMLVNVTRFKVRRDGTDLTLAHPEELAELIAKSTDSRWELELWNEPGPNRGHATLRPRITILRPDNHVLATIDSEFLRSHVASPSHDPAMNQLTKQLSPTGANRRYLDGLAEYLYGTVMKERVVSGDTVRSGSSYEHRFVDSIRWLRPFDRKVAAAVCSAAMMNINQFGPASYKTDTDLERARDFFRAVAELDRISVPKQWSQLQRAWRGITEQVMRLDDPKRRLAICPIDSHSSLLVNETITMIERGDPGIERSREFKEQFPAMDKHDRQKALVLEAIRLVHQQRDQQAASVLGELASSPFSKWADAVKSRRLEGAF